MIPGYMPRTREKRILGVVANSLDSKKPYLGMSLHWAYRVVGDFQLAEDVIQEAFIKMSEKGVFQYQGELSEGDFNSNPELFSYWRSILHRASLDLVREKTGRRRKCEEILFEDLKLKRDEKDSWHFKLFSRECSPAQNLEQKELADRLREEIDALPDYQRVVICHSARGLSDRDIAGIEKIHYTTVKTRLCRARNALRMGLWESGYFG
jgi:RNA polymerase sigma factor (sigma-70 family)